MRTEKQIRAIINSPEEFRSRLSESSEEEIAHDVELMRRLITEMDDKIMKSLQLRQRIVDVLHIIKEENDINMKDHAREELIKQRLISEYPEMEEVVHKLYDHLFDLDTI